MFTGIVETVGEVVAVRDEGGNKHFRVRSSISHETKPDNSVSHNGVCLTVTNVYSDFHDVTAVDETLKRSNLADWKTGTLVNLERAMRLSDRLEGHLVQGHVDTTAVCQSIEPNDGSRLFSFALHETALLVPKGSVCVNGVSLTVVDYSGDAFSVAIIPFTFEHTTFQQLGVGERVNVEFDIVGKYLQRLLQRHAG